MSMIAFGRLLSSSCIRSSSEQREALCFLDMLTIGAAVVRPPRDVWTGLLVCINE